MAMSWICPCGWSNSDERPMCGRCGRSLLEPQQLTVQPQLHAVPVTYSAPRQFICKTCDQGTLEQKKIFRMSGPVVFIGFIFLIPSVLGMIASALMFFGVMSSSVSDVTRARNEAVTEMRANDVPESIVTAVVAGQDEQIDRLMRAQDLDQARRSWVRDAQEKIRTGNVTSGAGVLFGGGFALALGIASFVGGLLGWLLVMRKRVLQCSVCRAVVSAS